MNVLHTVVTPNWYVYVTSISFTIHLIILLLFIFNMRTYCDAFFHMSFFFTSIVYILSHIILILNPALFHVEAHEVTIPTMVFYHNIEHTMPFFASICIYITADRQRPVYISQLIVLPVILIIHSYLVNLSDVYGINVSHFTYYLGVLIAPFIFYTIIYTISNHNRTSVNIYTLIIIAYTIWADTTTTHLYVLLIDFILIASAVLISTRTSPNIILCSILVTIAIAYATTVTFQYSNQVATLMIHSLKIFNIAIIPWAAIWKSTLKDKTV
jgi:hypothetical protein